MLFEFIYTLLPEMLRFFIFKIATSIYSKINAINNYSLNSTVFDLKKI
jgi:hypothetical protein